jgi:protein-L-isoaspartate(D-aspartate) O-methyltransferase
LGRTAEQALRRLNYSNVHTRIGDGFQGWSERAPFDKIIVTCSPEKIPTPLVEQLREGGAIVIPLGERYQQTLYRFQKVAGKLKSEVLEPTFFVPMTGTAEAQRERRDDSGVPQLINGGFESVDGENRPLGWYYVRQAEVVAAAAGQRCLRFRNETPGRGAQALQAIGVDGRQVQMLDVSIAVEARSVRPGPSATQDLPRLALSFFDEQRAPLGTQTLGPWTGTIPQATKQKRIRVPPRCRLAVVAVGLFGAVGELSVDEISVRKASE